MGIMQDFAAGGRAGQEIIYGQQQADAQTSLLSTQAEKAKMQLGAAKQEQTNLLAKRAALTSEQAKHSEWDMSQQQDVIKLQDAAIKRAANNPEVQRVLIEEKNGMVESYQKAQMDTMKLHEANNEAAYEAASKGFLDPKASAADLREMAKSTGNKVLEGLADVYEDKKPIDMFKDVQNPKGKLMSQLSPQERDQFRIEMDHSMGSKKADQQAKTILEAKAKADHEESLRMYNELKAAISAQNDATRREKIEADRTARQEKLDSKQADREAKKDKVEHRDKEMATEERQYNAARSRLEDALYGRGNVPGIPETIKNPKSSMFNSEPSEIPNPAYVAKQKAIEDLDKAHEKNMARFEAVDQGVKPSTNKEEIQLMGTVTKHGWSYEPNKYDYRIGEDGIPQRRAK